MKLILTNGTELAVTNPDVEKRIVELAMGLVAVNGSSKLMAKSVYGKSCLQWSDNDIEILKQMHKAGKRGPEIAEKLRRTPAAINAKLTELRKEPAGAEK